jgi:oligopeptide/dipeptide ABC transporter ATP-binding protein
MSLQVSDLQTYFYVREGVVKAVDGVSFEMKKGETMGIVGESGCGKSVTALSILRLVADPGRIVGGKIVFEGEDLLRKTDDEMRKIRGGRIAMIFQNPATSLNPVFTVGFQIGEAIGLHQDLPESQVPEKAVEMLKVVGIPEPRKRAGEYPHVFSGGMRQRAMIAMSLSCNPSLLIADEPTTALDVTIQAQILELMKELRNSFGASILLITHDIGLVAELAEKVAVMYSGHIVENASTEALFENPCHPYTQGLIASIPKPDVDVERLATIPGVVPDALNPPTGCHFHPRCPKAMDICKKEDPRTREVEAGHTVSCFLFGDA